MPAWIASALRLLIGSPARALGTGAVGGVVGERALGGAGIPDLFGLDEARPRRRRRRRALTASDRADIAFIVGLLGPGAGKAFATIVATRAS